ncbi:MAG: RES domain-containing protein [Vicinamibacterales bacterium]
MIVFRQTDSRWPFLWETADQPAGRWHGTGEGPAHYFADTPSGAWAEFLRHEEITNLDDLATVRRRMWAIDIGDRPADAIRLVEGVAAGGLDMWSRCQAEARRLRASGSTRLNAPSAALKPGGARGVVVHQGEHPGPLRDGRVIVVYGPPQDLVGWLIAEQAGPGPDLLDRVRHYGSG